MLDFDIYKCACEFRSVGFSDSGSLLEVTVVGHEELSLMVRVWSGKIDTSEAAMSHA